MMIDRKWIEQLISMALQEDLGERGDLTSSAILDGEEQGKAKIVARQEGILAGVEICRLVFNQVDSSVESQVLKNDGQFLSDGEVVLQLQGSLKSLLMAERTALNFLAHLSGIATLTHQFVEAIRGFPVKLLDTRKTTPGWRMLEKYAVKVGGGTNHRMGLYDMILIKENHIRSVGGINTAVQKCLDHLRREGITARIEIEVTSLDELKEALALTVDQIMLDNMSVSEIRQAVAITSGRVPLEASGTITLENIREIAATGVDFISVGKITHSAPAFDFSMLVE